MHSFHPIKAIVLFALLLAACAPEAPPEIPGSLYFGSGNYLALMSLRDGSTDIVASIGDAEITSFGPQKDSRVLLNVYGPVNQKNSHRLTLFDLESRQRHTFFEGRFGRYLIGGDTLIYDDGSKLWATWKQPGYWEKIEVTQHDYNAIISIVPISATAFVYSIGLQHDAPIYRFDMATAQTEALDGLTQTCKLDGAVWIEPLSQLLCEAVSESASTNYVITNLGGEVSRTLGLPSGKSFRALTYMPDQNAVILSEPWKSWLSERQKWAVWIYDLDDDGAYRLLEHQYLGQSAIYKPGR